MRRLPSSPGHRSEARRAGQGGSARGADRRCACGQRGGGPVSRGKPLVFVSSPMRGAGLTTASKCAVLAKSPLTGFIGDSVSSS